MTFEVMSPSKEHRHANVGTCRLHALDESVGRPACRGDVIDHQDALTTEEILVDVIALVCPVCEFVHVADMSLLTMAADDDMTEPVHSSEPLRKFLREVFVSDVVRPLATCRDAYDDGVMQVHQSERPCHFPCSPSDGVPPAALEVKDASVEVNLLERCPSEVSLRNVVI